MIQLIQGECLTEMQKIQSSSVDAIITDPPYGTTACKWDSVIPFEPMWEQLHRIIKPNGAIVLFGSEPFSSALRMSNIKNYKYDWKWDKVKPSNHLNAKKQPLRLFEDICVFYSSQPKYNPQMVKRIKPIKGTDSGKQQTYGKTKGGYSKTYTQKYPDGHLIFNKENNQPHPTQKPVALMEYLIKTYTNEGETVLDFTMGSGTTGVAAKNLNRSFIGIEQDPNYFKIAEERINKPDLFS